MYYETIQQFSRTLKNLSAILDKAQRYAEARKFDPNNLAGARLAPDMYTLVRQVQSACDTAKFSLARLAGQEAPKHEDNEKTLAELKERIGKCTAYLDAARADALHGAGERHVTLPWLEGKYVLGKDYLQQMAIPNFYFHASMVYAILRHNGVDIGKMDYIGSVTTHDR